MRLSQVARWAVLLAMAAAPALATDEALQIYTEHPRLFLNASRLKLLRRERERQSARWVQLESLISGKAVLPEPGFTEALYHRVSGDAEAGRRAVAWALGPGRDLRQLALVFDWCQELLTEEQSRTLAARLESGIRESERDTGLPAVRSRLLAAIALAGDGREISARVIEATVRGWWERQVLPALRAGRDPLAREHYYALLEILHAVRDNVNIDLRESDVTYFKDMGYRQLLAYYPASYPAGENEYRIPATRGTGEPDLQAAALARAADLAGADLDINSVGGQVLQGWAMHDRFVLRGAFGAPYEFLWANPYQPGLSYYHVPLLYHDERFGRLFVRSSWDEDASWLGAWDGQVQLFREGRPTVLNLKLNMAPIDLTEAVVCFASGGLRFKARATGEAQAFVLGLKPRQRYHVEVDGEEMRDGTADAGGILQVQLPAGVETGFRLSETAK